MSQGFSSRHHSPGNGGKSQWQGGKLLLKMFNSSPLTSPKLSQRRRSSFFTSISDELFPDPASPISPRAAPKTPPQMSPSTFASTREDIRRMQSYRAESGRSKATLGHKSVDSFGSLSTPPHSPASPARTTSTAYTSEEESDASVFKRWSAQGGSSEPFIPQSVPLRRSSSSRSIRSLGGSRKVKDMFGLGSAPPLPISSPTFIQTSTYSEPPQSPASLDSTSYSSFQDPRRPPPRAVEPKTNGYSGPLSERNTGKARKHMSDATLYIRSPVLRAPNEDSDRASISSGILEETSPASEPKNYRHTRATSISSTASKRFTVDDSVRPLLPAKPRKSNRSRQILPVGADDEHCVPMLTSCVPNAAPKRVPYALYQDFPSATESQAITKSERRVPRNVTGLEFVVLSELEDLEALWSRMGGLENKPPRKRLSEKPSPKSTPKSPATPSIISNHSDLDLSFYFPAPPAVMHTERTEKELEAVYAQLWEELSPKSMPLDWGRGQAY